MHISQVIKTIFPVDRTNSSDEWYTPEVIMIPVRKVLQTIDLDPCSCEEANKVVKAAKIYTKEQDGLSKHWQGKVWLNPPRGTDERISVQEIWVKRLLQYYKAGNIPEAIFIVRAVIGYHWFNAVWDVCPNVCFLRKRPTFYRGLRGVEAGQDQITGAVFYLGDNIPLFQRVFKPYGKTFGVDSYK
jgi:hypothetical protein